MRLGEKVRVIREAKGIEQTDLAERLGIHQVTLSQWERGTRPFNGDYVDAIAEALDVDPRIFHDQQPWAKIEAARLKYEAAMAEVQSILVASRKRRLKTETNPVFVEPRLNHPAHGTLRRLVHA